MSSRRDPRAQDYAILRTSELRSFAEVLICPATGFNGRPDGPTAAKTLGPRAASGPAARKPCETAPRGVIEQPSDDRGAGTLERERKSELGDRSLSLLGARRWFVVVDHAPKAREQPRRETRGDAVRDDLHGCEQHLCDDRSPLLTLGYALRRLFALGSTAHRRSLSAALMPRGSACRGVRTFAQNSHHAVTKWVPHAN